MEMPRDLAVAFHEESNDSSSPPSSNPHLDFIGRVNSRGFAVGNFWTSMGYSEASPFNNGFLYGPLDERGEMSGDNIVYVYPDLKTVLVGNFSANVMLGARASKVVAERCHSGLKVLRLARPDELGPVYKYRAGDELHVSGGQPTLVDPYETRLIRVGDIPGLGEGVFAKRDIKKG